VAELASVPKVTPKLAQRLHDHFHAGERADAVIVDQRERPDAATAEPWERPDAATEERGQRSDVMSQGEVTR